MPTTHEIKMIPISTIIVEDRERIELGEIAELAKSIKEYGLLHAIVVSTDSPPRLIAGGRRLLAVEALGWPEVPCHPLPLEEATPLKLKEIELEENIQRLDMTWQEKCTATHKIHQLKQEIYGEKMGRGTSPGWSINDTARLIGSARTGVAEDIIMGQALEELPELRECTSQAEAKAIFRRMVETVAQEELVRKAREEAPVDALALCRAYETSDVLDFLRKKPSCSCELCDVDPPYNLAMQSKDFHKKWSMDDVELEDIGIKAIDPDTFLQFSRDVLTECHRILNDDGWVILWHSAYPWQMQLIDILEDIGFHCIKPAAIWTKGQGKSRMPAVCLASSYEPFLYAYKGMPTMARKGQCNVFAYRPVPNQKRRHIAEKPIELMEDIFRTFVVPGSRIVVPFAGSGNSILAAHNLGMIASGCDMSKQFKLGYDSVVMKGEPYKSYASGPTSLLQED